MNAYTLTDVVNYSREHRVGIGMFNIENMEFAEAIFEAAQETGIPAMFGMPDRFITNFYDPYAMAAACRSMMERAKTPMAIHLDHGKSFDTVMIALRAGFTSVMYDGSSLPYEENVRNTAEIVRIAHPMGVSVEAELGYVGRVGDANVADGFTSPEQAEDFVARTNVDALAVAIGNQHGAYKSAPKLDFDRLSAIHERVNCGLVLHGGSGIAEADFVRAIHCGINKLNIHTADDTAALNLTRERIGEFGNYLDYTKAVKEAVKETVKRHIELFAGLRAPEK